MTREICTLLICTIFTCNYGNAQDLGAREDGNVKSSLNASELSREAESFTILYQGNSGDGFDVQSNQVLLLNSNFKIYYGRAGDGFSQNIAALTISGNTIDNLYGGNIGDGFSVDLSQSFLNGQELSILYRGHFGDGSDNATANALFLQGFMTDIFRGGSGDGFANLLKQDNYLTGLMLTLYKGGFGDGFAYNTLTSALTLDLVEQLVKMNVLLYPNPASYIVTIKPNDGVIITSIEVYDITGKEVNVKLSDDNTLNVSNLSDGIYLLNIYSENDAVTKKLIVKK